MVEISWRRESPQCTLTPLELATFLKTIATTSYILVARELHDDGHPHLHSLIIFADKLNVRSQTKFDHRGFHPNVQVTRDRQHVKDYCTKGAPSSDDLFEEGTFDSGKKGSASKEAWQAALDATTPEAVLAAVAIASPRDFTVSHDRIVAYANSKANVVPEYVPPPKKRSSFMNTLLPILRPNSENRYVLISHPHSSHPCIFRSCTFALRARCVLRMATALAPHFARGILSSRATVHE